MDRSEYIVSRFSGTLKEDTKQEVSGIYNHVVLSDVLDLMLAEEVDFTVTWYYDPEEGNSPRIEEIMIAWEGDRAGLELYMEEPAEEVDCTWGNLAHAIEKEYAAELGFFEATEDEYACPQEACGVVRR